MFSIKTTPTTIAVADSDIDDAYAGGDDDDDVDDDDDGDDGDDDFFHENV